MGTYAGPPFALPYNAAASTAAVDSNYAAGDKTAGAAASTDDGTALGTAIGDAIANKLF